jgi:predicted outer membrane protein
MSKIGCWGTTALAVILASYGAQAQTLIPLSPKDFVMAASQNDQYEVLAASVASVQGQDPRVRTFAQEMIQDYTASPKS